MNNGTHPQDLDAPPRVDLPAFVQRRDVAERPAVSIAAEAAVAANVETMMEELAKLIRVPSDVPPIGADAALKVSKCFEIVAADVRAIAADRVKAARELQQEAETYATVLEEAGKVLATRVSAESARAYKLSMILREAREIIAGPTPGESTQEAPPPASAPP